MDDTIASVCELCVWVRSCREFKNLNSFFAIIMGMSNPAVSRLSQTWEVNVLSDTIDLLFQPSWFSRSHLLFSRQKLPTKFKKFYAEFESMMVSCTVTFVASCDYNQWLTFDPGVFDVRTRPETIAPTDLL